MTQNQYLSQVIVVEGVSYIPLSLYEELKSRALTYGRQFRDEHKHRLLAEEKVEELADELYWTQDIIANPGLQGNLKAVLIATDRAVREARRRGAATKGELTHTYRDRVAEFAGCSNDVVTTCWKKAAENGLMGHEIENKRSEDGSIVKSAFVAIEKQTYLNPRGVAITTVRHGGVRVPECVHCHSTSFIQIQKRITFICTNPACTHCGVEVGEDEIAMVSEDQLEREREMLEREQAEQAAAVVAELAAREEEARKIIAWVREHGGNIRATSVGTCVLFLPDVIKLPVYKKVQAKVKEFEVEIARLVVAPAA